MLGLLLGASMIALIGFLDDYFDVSPFVRICFQILAAFGLGFLLGSGYFRLIFHL